MKPFFSKYLWVLIVIIICAALFTLFYTLNKNEKKIAWIDINGLYNDFDLKKEYETKLETSRVARKKVLDSLEFEIMILSKRSPQAAGSVLAQEKKEFYVKKKRALDYDDEAEKTEYQSRILKQMNQFVKDYGEKNNYHLIIGADGSGAIMYANKNIDITGEVKTYINSRYKGMDK